jgi:4-alpha-glucanotransferase
VLRVDHIMAWSRLYWIPHGMGLHEGTYVSYPHEELFAVLVLESHRHRCEIVGENLGTVPAEIDEALPRHQIRGMYLAQFAAAGPTLPEPPRAGDMALIGTHDTPPFAGWIRGDDIAERVTHGLLRGEEEPLVRQERSAAVQALARALGVSAESPAEYLAALLQWLGKSDSPLVVPWIEDLWLETGSVNIPGTRSSQRPNWQRPMNRLLEDGMGDSSVLELLRLLRQARRL